MNRIQRTYCRICEAQCGLIVDVDPSEQILAVRPDKAHPVSKGYSCIKGLAMGALHHDPERLNTPMKRVGDRWKRISWKQAISEIGAKVRKLRAEFGPRSLGMYTGNPTYFSFQSILYTSAFLESLHSPNLFASHSVDNNNKLHVATSMYGLSMVHPVPDLDHTRFFMCLGSNPLVSQMSMIQQPNALEKLKAIESRGGRVIFVDPRRTETADRVGEHISIIPGADVFLLLGLLHVLVYEKPVLDVERYSEKARAFADGIETFYAAGKPWTPERVAALTGISANEIRGLARDYASSDGAALYMSTGVNQGPFGSISYWVLQGLNFITGNTDRRGGLLIPKGAFDALLLAKALGLGSFDEHRTLVGGYHRVAGCFPLGALATEIDNPHPERIRALIVSAGNPVHSAPGGQKLQEALQKLDLLVAIDLYPNQTSRHAHYLLPATDMLERSDFPVSHTLLQTEPHAQFTEPVVSPSYERRPEWEILEALALASGSSPWGATVCNILAHVNWTLRKIPGIGPVTPDYVLSWLLRWGGQVSLSQLRSNPAGLSLAPTEPGAFLGVRVPTPNGKVNMAPAEVVSDLSRLEQHAEQLESKALVLIGRRERRTHNSWMHNNPRIKQSRANVATLHPNDATMRGISEGDMIEISTSSGQIQVRVKISVEVRPGVVAVPHGWGHQDSTLSRARILGGGNINDIIPSGPEHLEPVSGMAMLLGHPVEIRRVDEP